MASSPGFSIASLPPGAIGGVMSPVKSGTPSRKGPTANQLLEQIRQLEAEGNKLRSDTANGFGGPSIFAAVTDLNMSASTSFDKSELPKFTSTSPSSLSALVDITSEQKTISDLRFQLEQQKMESDRLNSHLKGDGFTSSISRVGTVLHIPSSPSKTGFSTLPSTELFGPRRAASTISTMEISPPSHLEKALKDSQEQVTDLRKRLTESNEQSESQRRQFRLSVEELKAKLHETVLNRDTLMELKHKETTTIESRINESTGTIRELQHKLKIQEQELVSATRKADGISRENYVSETTLNQVRLILVDSERRRGKPYFETDPASAQAPAMLVHTLERCVQEMLKDIEINKSKVQELESELSVLKQTKSSDNQNMSQEYHQKITQMTAEHERQMQAANDRAVNARKQSSTLESQLSVIQGQHDQQMKLKEDTLHDLENKIKHLREELHEEREKYTSKRESLEVTLSGTEKEMSKLRQERDDATRNHSAMETRLADLQVSVNRLNRDLESEKDNSGKFWEREGRLTSKQSELEARLGEKTKDVDRLEKMLSSVKQECNTTVSEKISMIERQERERHMDKISSLTSQLSEVSEKCNKLSLEHDNAYAENRELKQQTRELTDRSDTTKIQYDAAVAERKHLTDMLTAKTSDFDRVTQERDYYFNIMEQKNNELSELKTLKERLIMQIEEKDKNISIMKEQVTSLQQMLETTSHSSEHMREERDIYAQQLTETTAALEELKSSRELMAKKMKIREKKIREMESEKKKTEGELELRNQEMGIIQQEKETLFKELKDSRYEVANLTEEKDVLSKNLESQKYHMEKSIGKLHFRLKNADLDLCLTQKALRKRESVDNTAVKVADKMQKEVTAKRSMLDTLQSKIRWYQDQIDTLLKEKTCLDGDKDKLKSSLNKTLVQNQQLAVELDTANKRSIDLKNHANKLEQNLEKAALRNATTQGQVEMFEQEMTRMKLAHQLEIKEAVQKAMTSKQPRQSEMIENSPTVSVSQSTNQQPVSSTSTNHTRPEYTANEDRIAAQKSSENYKEIGSELKYLLNEMKILISDRQETDTPPSQSRRRNKENRPRPRPTQVTPPENRRRAFTHFRVPQTPSDISAHSDAEIDDRICHNRSRSTGHYALYSPERKENGYRYSRGKHRRSRSAEVPSFLAPKEVTFNTDSDYRTSDYSPPVNDTTDISDTNTDLEAESTGYGKFYSDSQTLDSDLVTSLSLSSPVMESTKEDPSPPPQLQPDTQAICRRLEERIAKLTTMGGNLQKENKEMADLMKTQGKKLKKVKENEKRISKTRR